jgi:hypothetical protein
VELWKPNRKPGRFWGFVFTSLACCVFLWGLQYKLSLYYPPEAAFHHVSMAKLLSKNEQSKTHETSAYTQTKPAIKALLAPSDVLPVILLVVCAVSILASSFQAAVNHPPLELRQALREAFFVRPPPFLNA